MAAAMSTVTNSSRCSQLTLFHSKLFFRPSSVAQELSLPGSSVLLPHSIKVVAPGACHLNSIQCRVYPPARYKRFRIIMYEPGGKDASKKQNREHYIQTLAKVVGRRLRWQAPRVGLRGNLTELGGVRHVMR